MKTSRKSIARVGAGAGVAALALLANPAFGSATVTGSAAVHVEGKSVVVEFTGITSPSLLTCLGQVKDTSGQLVAGNPASMAGDPAAGTYRSPALDDGTYLIEAICVDGDGVTTLTPAGGERITIGNDSGSSGFSFGSLHLTTGS
ncbi:hypothetical protein [Rhodococcus sp. NPDC058514]|uniref:hypothetical protein n=1 Tax=unclassified Rhodococcus (in: high G+C Gram-positive bacteria) TaxID=192944 RepID=UPI00365EC875